MIIAIKVNLLSRFTQRKNIEYIKFFVLKRMPI